MKLIKGILLAILAIIAVLLVTAIFVPKDFNYQKTITINAPLEKVWENTNSLADLDAWSPWNDYDPYMKKEFSGIDGTIGAVSNWTSDTANVGTGSQTITKIEPPYLFETKINFKEPFESEAKGIVKLEKEGDKTIATWGFESELPYPMNLMKLTMNMEETLGQDFNRGMAKLKAICEE